MTLREPVSSLTHAAGALAALVFTIVALTESGTLSLAILVYGLSMTLLYTTSSTYHGILNTSATAFLRRLDHAMIFVFIAGSYTPVIVAGLSGTWKVLSLVVIWGIALIGIGTKLWGTFLPRAISTSLYVAMGWASVFIWPALARTLPSISLIWLAAGGLIYTFGAIIYATKRCNPWPGVFGFHEVWHLFVLAGSAAHAVGIAYLLS